MAISRPSTRSICRKRPSGCLIRDLQNGSSFVTWVENVDVRENGRLHPKLIPLLSLGMHLERGAGSQIFKFKRAFHLLHGNQHFTQ
ncbi:hypothetical protein M0R45_035289 [Rubus argutus]|uniref:START domain-containing protein n=1 Tax=Rubus argutus TaxID=59490 RepID=A0AAW1VVK8_RUBAR